VVAPLVQVTLTVPVPLSAVVAFAETGSYAPNATGAVAIEQFAVTEAVTDRFEVAVAASVLEAAPIANAAVPAAINFRTLSFCLNMVTPKKCQVTSIETKVAPITALTKDAVVETVCCAAW
jgi:hypothetical protein